MDLSGIGLVSDRFEVTGEILVEVERCDQPPKLVCRKKRTRPRRADHRDRRAGARDLDLLAASKPG